MIPPVFDLSQDDDFVLVIIRTPYVKISDVEFYIDGTEFKFYVKPYFLRLNLPGELVEDGRESATYDLDKGTFSVKLPKLHPGEFFEDLDLLTTLLAPRRQAKSTTKALIEETGKGESINEVRQENGSKSEDEDFDWDIEQQLPPASQENIAIALGDAKYGFANQKSGIFKGREAELHEIAEIHDPESMTLAERRKFRKEAEDVKFDEEYYLADFFNEEQIQPLLNYKPPWIEIVLQEGKSVSIKKKDDSSRPNKSKVHFTGAEKDQLRRLPNRDYKEEELSLYLGLVDIIYAYAYNHRTTEGENTVESSWTIARISSTFSWFESFTTLSDVLISSARRSLAYPLYRHWSLVEAVIKDTKKIFALGRRQILKCLLEIHALCREEDPWYLLNDLYVTDYCVWTQKASRNKLASLAHSLEQIEIRKSELSWQLEELELAATLVQKEEQGDIGDQEASEQQKGNEDVTNSDNDEDRDKDDVDDDVDDDDDEDNDDDDDDDDDDDVGDDIVDDDYDDDYGDEDDDDDDDDTDDDHSTRHKTEANVKTVNTNINGDICSTLQSVESPELTTTEFIEDQVKL